VGGRAGRGPGASRALLTAVLGRRPVPTVLDADALMLFEGGAERPLVVTPHPVSSTPRGRPAGDEAPMTAGAPPRRPPQLKSTL
jgi:hypothetical protein